MHVISFCVSVLFFYDSITVPGEHAPPLHATQVCESPFIESAQGAGTDIISVRWTDPFVEQGKTYDLEVLLNGSPPTGEPTVTGLTGTKTIVGDLESGTGYDIFIRGVCIEGTSEWNGPVYVQTYISNDAGCGILLAIDDNNCPDDQEFIVFVEGDTNALLGVDVTLRSVELIVQHPWLADLSIYLENPNGVRILLSSDNGVGEQDFGVPGDTACSESLTFTMDACISITELVDNFVGEVRPEEPLDMLNDSTRQVGNWKLIVCDKGADDIGSLRYIKIGFGGDECAIPQLSPGTISDTSFQFNISNAESCDSVLILWIESEHWPDFTAGDSMTVACDAEIVLDALAGGQEYVVVVKAFCDSDTSAYSCPLVFATSCAAVTISSSFDDLPQCEASCLSNCAVGDEIWHNSAEDDFDWILHSGSTETDFTGPLGDRNDAGIYLYTESSVASCQDSAIGILKSVCLRISASQGVCHLGFSYHMYGSSMGSLVLELSSDAGKTWASIWSQNGNQGDQWQDVVLDLSLYDGRIATLRFLAFAGPGFQSDMALDQIQFFGTTVVQQADKTFFADTDDDGFGRGDSTICHCEDIPPSGFVSNDQDCNDDDAGINPDAAERPCNLIDDNCNDLVDEGVNPDPIQFQMVQIQDATCTGIADGLVEISITQGAPPFDIRWNSGQDTTFVDSLASGVYWSTITDANGCVAITGFFIIGETEELGYALTEVMEPSCVGVNDGAISGTVTGGTMPFAFEWSNGDMSQNISEIGEGIYSLTLTDDNGCWLVADDVFVDAPSAFQVNILDLQHAECFESHDGSILIGVSGGFVEPVQFAWSSGDTTPLVPNLPAGFYACTITDANGCQTTIEGLEIEQPDSLLVQIVVEESPTCDGGSDGSIQLTTGGGSPPYFYQWSNGRFTDDIFNITAGGYVATISDINGCQVVLDTIVLSAPPELIVQLEEKIDVACPGDSTGRIQVEATGGTPPYIYIWSNEDEGESIHGLFPGVYTVTISDALGCKKSIRDIPILSNDIPITLQVDSQSIIKCFADSTGYISLITPTGIPPLRFNWSIGVQHISHTGYDTLAGLPAGSYSVTVTDDHGCVGSSELFVFDQPAPLVFVLDSLRHNICFEGADGAIEVSASGGVSPISYQWSNGEITSSVSDLTAGNYDLTITDGKGCTLEPSPFLINQPDSVHISFEVQHQIGGKPGWAQVMVDGATGRLSFQWDKNAGAQTTTRATGLLTGTYSVTITDEDSCEYSRSVTVELVDRDMNIPHTRFKVFPNPAASQITISGDHLPTTCTVWSIEGQQFHLPLTGSAELRFGQLPDLTPGLYLIQIEGEFAPLIVIKR